MGADEASEHDGPADGVASERRTISAERFTIIRKLGEGAFGRVYEARDQADGRHVALKELSDTRAEWLEGFKREFRALQELRHPNLVVLDELFLLEGRWFFTMELLCGVDLVTYVRRGAAHRGAGFDEQLVRATFRQLLEGLAALHAAGKIHRDVKPSNVLVTGDGRTVLLDFGLLTEAAGDSRAQAFLAGTPSYMAPEQASMTTVGFSADLYAVGVMLYEALTGELPFSSDPSRLLWMKCNSDPPCTERLRDAPKDLAALTTELLQRAPDARPTALEAVARLGGDRAGSRPLWWSGFWPSWLPPAPMVGREHELSTLRTAFEASETSYATTILVSGVSGVGKTTLVRSFTEDLRRNGHALVFSGRCYERESVPFKAFDEIVDDVIRYLSRIPREVMEQKLPRDGADALVRMFPALQALYGSGSATDDDPEPPMQVRHRGFAALRELLHRTCEERPLVLWFDDVQWADADSGALLASLSLPPWNGKLVLLLSHRATEGRAGPFWEAFFRSRSGELVEAHITLSELVPSESRLLARTLLEQEESDAGLSVETIVRESGGNPLFIKVLVSLLHEQGMGGRNSRLSEKDVSLEHAIMQRVKRLPSEARRVLEIAAVAGSPISQQACAMASDLGEAVHEPIGLLRAAQLVRTRGTSSSDLLMTYHDRISEAVLANLSSREASSIHLKIAEALEQVDGSDAEMLVVHFRAAGELSHAGAHAVAAADGAAASLAFDRAARLYRLALELQQPTGAARDRIERALGNALANAGMGKAAAEVFLSMASRAAKGRSLELRRLAGEQLLRSGHVDEGFRVADSVLEGVDARPSATPRRALLSLLGLTALLKVRGLRFVTRRESDIPEAHLRRVDAYWSAGVAAGVIDTIRAAELQARHLLAALEVGEPYRVARALCLQAAHLSTRGDPVRNELAELTVLMRQVALESGHPHALALTELAEGMSAWFLGDTGPALERCTRAESMFRSNCTGVTWEMTTARIFANNALAIRGEMATLRNYVSADTQAARERGDRYGAWTGIAGVTVLGHLAADTPMRAREELVDGLEHWSKNIFTVQHHWSAVATALVDLYMGTEAAALQRLPREIKGHVSSFLFRIELIRILVRFVHANCLLAAQAPARHGAVEFPRKLGRLVKKEKSHWGRPLGTLVEAAVAWSEGDEQSTVAQLRTAIAGFDAAEMRLFSAAARRRLGQVLGGEEGRALVVESESWMATQAILQPARMTRTLAPGYPDFD